MSPSTIRSSEKVHGPVSPMATSSVATCGSIEYA